MSKPVVSIVMGSDSDLEIMRETGKALEEFGIEYEIDVTSAHRSPDRTADFARKAAGRGIRVIVAGAGGIPVATVAIGKPGATNAGILAAQMIGLADNAIAKKLDAHKEKLARGVEEKSQKLKASQHP